jgi:hypothetical protein
MEADADVVLNKPLEFVDLDHHVTELLVKKGL